LGRELYIHSANKQTYICATDYGESIDTIGTIDTTEANATLHVEINTYIHTRDELIRSSAETLTKVA